MKRDFTPQNWIDVDRLEDMVQSLRKAAMVPVNTISKAFTSPSLDLRETADRYIFEVEVPGFDKSEIELVIKDGLLTISGKKDTLEGEEEQEKTYLIQERRLSTSFKRSITLAKQVEQDSVSAKFENGMLIIEIPKIEKTGEGLKVEIK